MGLWGRYGVCVVSMGCYGALWGDYGALWGAMGRCGVSTGCLCPPEEAAQVLERLNRAQPPPNIDISPPRRPQLLPDARALMATLELAPDPFFGVMAPPLPSPTELMELPRLEEELPPMELPELTVSPEIITLREPEPPMVPALEEELPEVTPRELELLSEAEVELLPTVEEVAEVPRELPPPRVPPVREEPGVLPPEAPRRRKVPRLPHSDPQPQIPQAEFRALLLQPEAHCQPLVIPEPPSLRRLPPAELFQTPTIGWLPPELQELWGRGARPGPVELPSEVEVPREALEPSLPVVLSSGETPGGALWGGYGAIWGGVGRYGAVMGHYGVVMG
uniref:Uncharacterized protein n=1 Tax=Anas platyrhynchos platyrhynchos TaxID=8840 RepID=A0A493THU1_ANAPP